MINFYPSFDEEPMEPNDNSLDDNIGHLQNRFDQLVQESKDKRQLASMTDDFQENLHLQISAVGDEQLALAVLSQICALRQAQTELNNL